MAAFVNLQTMGRMGALWPDATLQEAASARDLPGGGH
jgi:hypothetical protein